MVVQQNDTEDILDLMSDENLSNGGGKEADVSICEAGAGICNAWQRVVVFSRVRKHCYGPVDFTLSKD